jgi:hypothetical protein
MSFTSKIASAVLALAMGLLVLPGAASAAQVDGWYRGKNLVSEQPLPSAQKGEPGAIWLCPVRDGKPATSQYACGWFMDPDHEIQTSQVVSNETGFGQTTCPSPTQDSRDWRVWWLATGCSPVKPGYVKVGDCTESGCPFGPPGYNSYSSAYTAQPRPSLTVKDALIIGATAGVVSGLISHGHHHYDRCDRWGYCY